LKEPYKVKKPSKIFVCSIADLFASWTPAHWRNSVLISIKNCPIKHTFQLLTKNPELIPPNAFINHHNVWIGTTVTQQSETDKIEYIKAVNVRVRFLSFEPLLGLIDFHKTCLLGVQWIIIGKLTGSKKIKLNWLWISEILQEAKRHNIPVFMKNNLGSHFPIQEFPKF